MDTTGVGHSAGRKRMSSALRSGQNVQCCYPTVGLGTGMGVFTGNGQSLPAPGTAPPLPWVLPCTAGGGDKAPLAPELALVPLSSVQVHQGTPWVSVGSAASPSSQLG